MLTLQDFAALALHVYKNQTEIMQILGDYVKGTLTVEEFAKNAKNKFIKDGIYEFILNPEIQNNLNQAFYASVYVAISNEKLAAAILAIRGTVDIFNAAQDIITWGDHVLGIQKKLHDMPAYTEPAKQFLSQVEQFCQQQWLFNSDQIYITGHSLGGAIAALLKAEFGALNRIISFNAPGIRSMPNVDIHATGIFNVRAHYDFVSTIDFPIGFHYDVDVPQNAAIAKQAFELHQLRTNDSNLSTFQKLAADFFITDDVLAAAKAQHSMSNLYQAIIAKRGVRHNTFLINS